MSDAQDKKLDEMLRSRRIEPAAPDLAERVILKARAIPQRQTALGWMQGLFTEMHLPRPAYVLAATLILGVLIGLNTTLDAPAEDADAVQVQSFLYADEDDL